jgi:hypothetical protein
MAMAAMVAMAVSGKRYGYHEKGRGDELGKTPLTIFSIFRGPESKNAWQVAERGF